MALEGFVVGFFEGGLGLGIGFKNRLQALLVCLWLVDVCLLLEGVERWQMYSDQPLT